MSYSVIEVVKYTCDNLMVSFCKVFGYRWQFVTETTKNYYDEKLDLQARVKSSLLLVNLVNGMAK